MPYKMKRPENESVAPSLKKFHGGYHKGQVNDAVVEEMNDNIATGKGPAKPKSVVSARPKSSVELNTDSDASKLKTGLPKLEGEDEKLDKKILKESKKRLIADKKKEFKSGDITRKEFKEAKKEIKGYTDVDAAKDHFNEADFKTVKQERRDRRIKNKGDRRSEGSKVGQFIRRITNPNKATKI